jgi:hypothetical protein
MFEKTIFRIFLICLVGCASLVLTFVWRGVPPAQIYFQIAATLFVVGLGSFLIWFSTMLYSLRSSLRD